MEKILYGFWIELDKNSVWVINHEIAYFEERVFKILTLQDRIQPCDYETRLKIFELSPHIESIHSGTSYEIKKILKE